ncbi:MAG: hypothetical protein U9P44_03535, partial [archaeon]|nr:hypothetical protein [archaeon]
AAVLNKKLRMMGATEVYYLSGTPPVTSPCYGGINTYRKDLAVTQIEETRGINAVDIGNDYYGTGAHKQFEEALMYFEHEPVIMEKLGGPIITDGVGFLSIYGLNKVLDMFNLQQSAQCCVTGKYPYKFRGIKGHGSFVPTAGYRDAIRNNAISPVKI